MSRASSLIQSVVEMDLDTSGLNNRLQQLVAQAQAAGGKFRDVFNRQIAWEISRADQRAKDFQRTLKSTYALMNPPRQPRPKTMGESFRELNELHKERIEKTMGTVNSVKRIALTGVAAGTGAAFGLAAAAGSTTLDTLTGSIRMLSLEIGSRAQPAIMALSRVIQRMARGAREADEGTLGKYGGGIAGAVGGGWLGSALGTAIGGPIGGLIGGVYGAGLGGAGGAIGGRMAERSLARDERVENMARQFTTNEDLATKGHAAVSKYFKSVQGRGNLSQEEIRRGDVANEISAALARAEDPDFRKHKDEFLRAGLNMPAQFSGLEDLRKQAQLSVFDQGGPLGAANSVKELQNNLAAVGGKQIDFLQQIADNTRKDKAQDKAADVRAPDGAQ